MRHASLLSAAAALLLAAPAAAQQDSGFVHVECAPLGNLADAMGVILPIISAQVPEAAEDEVFATLLSLAGRDQLAAAGLDPASAARFLLSGPDDEDPAIQLSVGFTGDAAAAEELLGLLEPHEMTVNEDGSWSVVLADKEDAPTLRASVADGALTLRTDAEVTHGLVEPLPADWTTQGCGMQISIPEGVAEDGPAAFEMLDDVRIFVPLPDAGVSEATFKSQLSLPGAPPWMTAIPEQVAMGTSTVPPVMVGTFGAPLLEVLGQEPFSGIVPLPVLDLQALSDHVTIEPGATVALMNSPMMAAQLGQDLDFVLAMRVRTHKGGALKPGQLGKALRELVKNEPGWSLEKSNPRTYAMTREGRTFHMHLAKQALYLGTNPGVVAASAAGEGAPWHAEAATDWSVTVAAADLTAFAPLPLPQQYGAALRLRVDGEGRLDAEFGLSGENASVAIMGALAAIAIPNFVQMQKRAKRAELPSNVDAIRTAVLAYHAEHGVYPTVPAAPRPLSEMDGEAVEWTGGPEWESIGWAPDGEVRGVYWVEVSEDGASFTVYGAADLDGDGIECRYAGDQDKPAEALTPPTVY